MLKNLDKLATLLQLCDSNGSDSDILKLLDDEPPEDEDSFNRTDAIVPVARPQLRPDHAVALQVLRGGADVAAPQNITRKFKVAAGGRVGDIMVTFDNCTHASGHQRGYVSCCRGGRGAHGHQVSFKQNTCPM